MAVLVLVVATATGCGSSSHKGASGTTTTVAKSGSAAGAKGPTTTTVPKSPAMQAWDKAVAPSMKALTVDLKTVGARLRGINRKRVQDACSAALVELAVLANRHAPEAATQAKWSVAVANMQATMRLCIASAPTGAYRRRAIMRRLTVQIFAGNLALHRAL
jgi:hypothetical protein